MDSSPPHVPAAFGNGSGEPVAVGGAQEDKEEGGGPLTQVDPFLVEALENTRHRLTVLRMELDVQRFMQNPDQYQFEFQQFPSSYLRRAAHRVAQHYGLQTMVTDNALDGIGRIVVRKTPESRYPAVCLSDVRAKQPENEKPERVKIAIRPRPNKASLNDAMELGIKRSPARTVEEREEEYDRARARIFNSSSNPEVEDASSETAADGKSQCSSNQENEGYGKMVEEPERNGMTERNGMKDVFSRVAIFRDREKDRTDPDYDRSYDRYSRGVTPNQIFKLGPYNMLQPSYLEHESGFPQLGQFPQTSVHHVPSNPMTSPYCAAASHDQTSGDAIYMQWPNPTMMYSQSYEHFRHSVFQAPFYQQPLSFEHCQDL